MREIYRKLPVDSVIGEKNNAKTSNEIISTSEIFVSGKNMKNISRIWTIICQVTRIAVQMFNNGLNKCCDRIKSIEWINILYSYVVSSIIFDGLHSLNKSEMNDDPVISILIA